MSRVIHKRRLAIGMATAIPRDAEVLHVALQADEPMVWYLTTDDAPLLDERFIQCVGTGWALPTDLTREHFLGTIIEADGGFVWHFFDPQRRKL